MTEAYARLIAEWEANSRRLPATPTAKDPTIILDIVVRDWDWAKAEDVEKPANLQHIRAALRPLRDLYGTTPAAKFGPKKLKIIQTTLAKQTDPRSGAALQVYGQYADQVHQASLQMGGGRRVNRRYRISSAGHG